MSEESTPRRGRGAGRRPRTAALTGQREPMLALPGVDGREFWPRQANQTYSAIVQHCGGAESITEIEALTARRVSVLEAELRHLEIKFAALRSEGKAPTIADLDLYGRLANSQHRLNTALGIERRARDITPSLGEYLNMRATVTDAVHDAVADAIPYRPHGEPEQLSWVDGTPSEPQGEAAYD